MAAPVGGRPSASCDYRLLLVARLVRGFGFGVASVLLAIYLAREGESPGTIGLLLGVAVAASALLGLAFAAASARLGRRACLGAAGLLMAISGAGLAWGGKTPFVFVAAATGMMGASNIDAGPFAAVEQAVLAESVRPPARNLAFARYSLTGGLAFSAGALSAGLATTVERMQIFLLVYAAIGMATSVLAVALSRDLDRLPGAGGGEGPPLDRPSAQVAKLSALFAVDSLGGGFVVPSVVALWLHVRFGLDAGAVGPAFAAMSLVQAASSELSGRLANRIGLVRTMVFTHLPSNALLLLVPAAPNAVVAIALLIARSSLSQMDSPARQAFVVSIVPPARRASAAATVGAARGFAQTGGPILAGIAIGGGALALPFLVAGSVKAAYDVALYTGFRHLRGDHERG